MSATPTSPSVRLNGYLAEVKAVRAYCYFTLVRAFRDIPFSTEPVIDDTVQFRLPQSDPDDVINFLIDDLKAIEPSAVSEWSQVAYTKGRMTQNAVRCLIADMCLWQGRYAEAEEYCNRILSDGKSGLSLVPANNYSYGAFIGGNSTESIFEPAVQPRHHTQLCRVRVLRHERRPRPAEADGGLRFHHHRALGCI